MSPLSPNLPRRNFLATLTACALLPWLAGCAMPGATFGSGVGDAYLREPPWYAGPKTGGTQNGGTAFGVLPVSYQPGTVQPDGFDPALTADMQRLLADMSDHLAAMEGARPLLSAQALSSAPVGVPPDVQFHCVVDLGEVLEEDCAIAEGQAAGRGILLMRLAVARPSAAWSTWIGGLMDAARVDRVLLVTLETGQYRIRQSGLRGDKHVELGTDHVQNLPWLTSLDAPVSVVQLTGVLWGRDDLAQRIGAEGIIAKRSRFPVSMLGAQELITAEDIALLADFRREDLPGKPLAWITALETLVRSLTAP